VIVSNTPWEPVEDGCLYCDVIGDFGGGNRIIQPVYAEGEQYKGEAVALGVERIKDLVRQMAAASQGQDAMRTG
jgi:hypothetical protein